MEEPTELQVKQMKEVLEKLGINKRPCDWTEEDRKAMNDMYEKLYSNKETIH